MPIDKKLVEACGSIDHIKHGEFDGKTGTEKRNKNEKYMKLYKEVAQSDKEKYNNFLNETVHYQKSSIEEIERHFNMCKESNIDTKDEQYNALNKLKNIEINIKRWKDNEHKDFTRREIDKYKNICLDK